MFQDVMSDHLHHLSRLGQERWWGWPLGGISLSWAGGLLAEIDGTAQVNLIAMGILAIGSSLLGLWRLWESNQVRRWKEREIAEIEIDEARRASLARTPIVTIVSPSTTPLPVDQQ